MAFSDILSSTSNSGHQKNFFDSNRVSSIKKITPQDASTINTLTKPNEHMINNTEDFPAYDSQLEAKIRPEIAASRVDTRVKIYPEQATAYEGNKIAFSCVVLEGLATRIDWLLNGDPVQPFSIPDVEMEVIHTAGNLVFKQVSVKHNNSNIQCRVQFSDSETFLFSRIAHLLVQGKFILLSDKESIIMLLVSSSYYKVKCHANFE